MFSTGNFKNNIGEGEVPNQPNPRDSEYDTVIKLPIQLGKDYAWAAMDETAKQDSELTQLAPTVSHSNKCLFVVRVTYYLQLQLMFGLLKRPLGIKLPFVLKRCAADVNSSTSTKINNESSAAASPSITKLNVSKSSTNQDHDAKGGGGGKKDEKAPNDVLVVASN